MTKQKAYWLCQIGGWGIYGFLQVFLYTLAERFDFNQFIGVFVQVIYFIITSHLLRFIILKFNWLNLRLVRLIPVILVLTFFLSSVNYLFLLVLESIADRIGNVDTMIETILINVLGYWAIYFIWIIFYFTFHYVERYNNSLKEAAATREVELRNLRAQLNPHFIFNALNSIRALVDENPRKSKEAITQLSHILRNSLSTDRKKLISFTEELKTVMDYLALESIRYEERLRTSFNIGDGTGAFMIPPLMIQTLVENGIKHGISNLKDGGLIEIKTEVKDKQLQIEIRNTGQLNQNQNVESGFGLANTRKRLDLIFGEDASFELSNDGPEMVRSKILIPKLSIA